MFLVAPNGIVAGFEHFPLTLLQASVPHCSLGSSLLSLDVHGLWCVGFFLASTYASGNGFGRGDFGEGNQNQCQVCHGSLASHLPRNEEDRGCREKTLGGKP